MSSRRRRACRLAVVLPVALLGCLVVAAPTLGADPKTKRVSISSAEAEGDDVSLERPSISADGRYVAFYAHATNLVDNDTNSVADVFVRDRKQGITRRVSISSAGSQANGHSYYPSISADGRYVAFASEASDLVANDTNGVADVFVRDRQQGTTRRVSISSAEGQGNGGNGSYYPSISADGRYVVFQSDASDLVGGDTTGLYQVFVRDRQQGTTRRVSISSAEDQANGQSFQPSISADGGHIAFWSVASNLVANDTNGRGDVFVRDRQQGTTRRVSISSAEGQGNGPSFSPSISADGRYVAFWSNAKNLVSDDTNRNSDAFVRDRQQGTTERVSISSAEGQGNARSGLFQAHGRISANGRYVAFESLATNLVANDTNGVFDVFVRDRQAGTTRRASISSARAQANGPSASPSVSADGRFIAFWSEATNLVGGDTNGGADIFVRGPLQ